MGTMVDKMDSRSEAVAPNEGRLEGMLPSNCAKRRSFERPACGWVPKGQAQGVRFLAVGGS